MRVLDFRPLVLALTLVGCGNGSGTQGSSDGAGGSSGGESGAPAAGRSPSSSAGGSSGAVSSSGGAAPTGGTAPSGGQTSASGGRAGATGGGSGAGPAGEGGRGGASSGGGSGAGGAPTGGVASGGVGEGGAAAGGSPSGAGAGGGSGGSGGSGAGSSCGPVTEVPESVRSRLDLDAFYRKHVDANGVSVLASDAPSDESLILACELLNNMLSERDDVRRELIRRGARFAIIGRDEGTADIPEYGYRDGPQEDIDYINQRARGLGGIVASCGEENILCLDGDRYFNESICVHEFAHTISMYGVFGADDAFEDALEQAFDDALSSGILDGTYRTSNVQEYWAEGVQDWYDTNASANPPNGVHNQVNTRAELADFDPTLHALIADLFPDETAWGDCHVEG